MLVFAVFAAAIGLAALIRLTAPRVRRRWVLRELHGDWWTGFERELETYAGTWRTAREAERRSN